MRGKSGIRQSGAFELKQATWALRQAQLSPEAAADPVLHAALAAEDIRDWFTRMPWRPGPLPAASPSRLRGLSFRPVGTRRGRQAFWRQLGIWAEGYHRALQPRGLRPHVIVVGPVSADRDIQLQRPEAGRPRAATADPGAMDARRPQSHAHFGDVEFGPAASLDAWAGDWRAYRLRFFDHVIKDAPLHEPPVRVFVMGGGSGRRTADAAFWTTAATWLAGRGLAAARHRFRFRTICTRDGAARSRPRRPRSASLRCPSISIRPRPVPTIGGAMSSLEPVAAAGSWDQTEAAGFFGCDPPYLPLASRAGCAGVPDQRRFRPRRFAYRRAGDGGIVRRDRRTGYRFHRQVDRCPSALGRLSAGLRDDPDRRHHAAALRRGLGNDAEAASLAGRCVRAFRSRCSRPQTCSFRATGYGWMCRRPTSRNSTSIRTPASQKVERGGGASP